MRIFCVDFYFTELYNNDIHKHTHGECMSISKSEADYLAEHFSRNIHRGSLIQRVIDLINFAPSLMSSMTVPPQHGRGREAKEAILAFIEAYRRHQFNVIAADVYPELFTPSGARIDASSASSNSSGLALPVNYLLTTTRIHSVLRAIERKEFCSMDVVYAFYEQINEAVNTSGWQAGVEVYERQIAQYVNDPNESIRINAPTKITEHGLMSVFGAVSARQKIEERRLRRLGSQDAKVSDRNHVTSPLFRVMATPSLPNCRAFAEDTTAEIIPFDAGVPLRESNMPMRYLSDNDDLEELLDIENKTEAESRPPLPLTGFLHEFNMKNEMLMGQLNQQGSKIQELQKSLAAANAQLPPALKRHNGNYRNEFFLALAVATGALFHLGFLLAEHFIFMN